MKELIISYQASVLVLGLTGILSLVQLLIFDAMAIYQKHPPGHPIESNHKNLLFRLSRAHANTNETMGVMILSFLFAVMSNADHTWVNSLMLTYLITRVLHMICYYMAWSSARGVIFGVSIVSLLGLLASGMVAFWN